MVFEPSGPWEIAVTKSDNLSSRHQKWPRCSPKLSIGSCMINSLKANCLSCTCSPKDNRGAKKFGRNLPKVGGDRVREVDGGVSFADTALFCAERYVELPVASWFHRHGDCIRTPLLTSAGFSLLRSSGDFSFWSVGRYCLFARPFQVSVPNWFVCYAGSRCGSRTLNSSSFSVLGPISVRFTTLWPCASGIF